MISLCATSAKSLANPKNCDTCQIEISGKFASGHNIIKANPDEFHPQQRAELG